MTGPQDPPIIQGPWQPRHTAAAVLALLGPAGYPDLCRAGIWHAQLTVCRWCDSPDGCDCAVQAADAAALLAHPIALPAPAALAAAGTTPTAAGGTPR